MIFLFEKWNHWQLIFFQLIDYWLTVAALVGRACRKHKDLDACVFWSKKNPSTLGRTWVNRLFLLRLLWKITYSALSKCPDYHTNHVRNPPSTLLIKTQHKHESESCLTVTHLLVYHPERETHVKVSELTGFDTYFAEWASFIFLFYFMNELPRVFLHSKAMI